MNKIMAVIVLVALVVVAQSFIDEPDEMAPVRIPERESTWVKTEKVRLTKGEAVDGVRIAPAQISVNAELMARLTRPTTGDDPVSDAASCLRRLAPVDLKRTAVQKAGGVWHVFESRPDTRIYSHHGMQIDSKTNKMIFALRHLCETAHGVPMDGLATYISGEIDERGLEGAERYLFDLEKSPGVIDVWVDYAETAKKNATRTVDYAEIDGLISRTEPLVDFYVALSKRNVDDASVKAFLSDAVTLGDVLERFLSEDKIMAMALKEDNDIPAYEFEGEM